MLKAHHKEDPNQLNPFGLLCQYNLLNFILEAFSRNILHSNLTLAPFLQLTAERLVLLAK